MPEFDDNAENPSNNLITHPASEQLDDSSFRSLQDLNRYVIEQRNRELLGVKMDHNSREFNYREMCWDAPRSEFIDLRNGRRMSTASLNRAFDRVSVMNEDTGETERILPAKFFDRQLDRMIVDGESWVPIDQKFVEVGTKLYANTYNGFAIEPEEGECFLWLDLMKHTWGDKFDIVLQHCAYSVQHPDKKINWQILGYGKPRTGKTLSTLPLQMIWGAACRTASPKSHNSAYEDIYYRSKLIILEEVYAPEDRDFFNSLKVKLANKGYETLNIKYGGQVQQQNCYQMIMFTNHIDALHFDADEDKLLIVKTPDVVWSTDEIRDKYTEELEQSNLAGRVLHHLLNVDLSSFNSGRLPERTETAVQMSKAGSTVGEQELHTLIEDGEVPFDGRKIFIFEDVRDAMRSTGYRVTAKNASKVLNSMGYVKVRGKKNGVFSPVFWAKNEEVEQLSPSESYDFFEKHKSDLFSSKLTS